MNFESKWSTFKGKVTTFNTIDHQHLSNIYWYYRIVIREPLDSGFLIFVCRVLNERFNGQILEYRPHIECDSEITYLENSGALVWDDETETSGKIYFNGIKEIGRIVKPI